MKTVSFFRPISPNTRNLLKTNNLTHFPQLPHSTVSFYAPYIRPTAIHNIELFHKAPTSGEVGALLLCGRRQKWPPQAAIL